jgi:alpha-N-acetylglucosamine transferase
LQKQRSGLRKNDFISDENKFYDFISKTDIDQIDIESIHLTDSVVHRASYVVVDEEKREGDRQNVAIGAFTTLLARLRLYEALEYLGPRILYHDTDSVIWLDEGKIEFPSIDKLCYFKSEWDDDIYAKEFFATAPKSYGYVLNTGEKTMKIKGISLNQHQVQIVKPGEKNEEDIIKSTRIFDLDMMKAIFLIINYK